MKDLAHTESGTYTSPFKTRYDNFIGGSFVAPVNGRYFENVTPITGEKINDCARSDAEDVELALDAAHAAKGAWGKTSATERANLLLKIADAIDANLELLAQAETWDNGKPIRETMAADIPLSADHFRYFSSVLRGQEGSMSEIDADTVAYHYHEPLGVVGQIIPWNFSILMAAWKLAPALAAGNCIVMKPAEQTPAAIMVLAEIIADILPMRRAEHRQRLRGRGRRGAGHVQAHRQDRLYRLDRDGPHDHESRHRKPDPRDAGTGRQKPQHLFRRHHARG